MDIAVLGTGTIATAIGARWVGSGHNVSFGSREPERARRLATRLQAAGGGGLREAAAGAEVVLLAAAWQGAVDTIRAAGDLDGKVVLDPTNPVDIGTWELRHEHGSLAERVAAAAPGARIVKAFNTIFARNLELTSDTASEHGLTLFLAGDDPDSKAMAGTLGEPFGLHVTDVGTLAAAGALESLAWLLIQLVWRFDQGPAMAINAARMP